MRVHPAICAVLVVGSALGALSGCGSSPATRDVPPRPTPLASVIVQNSQLPRGYALKRRPDSTGVEGYVTLDLCGFEFRSEALRSDRLQVDYVHPPVRLRFGNEVVRYEPGGAEAAMQELRTAIRTCPQKPVGSSVQGITRAQYRIHRLSVAGLVPSHLVFRLSVRARYRGRPVEVTSFVAYQVHGALLSGIYTDAGRHVPFSRQKALGIRAARASAENLRASR
jgi:hypothetical protein